MTIHATGTNCDTMQDARGNRVYSTLPADQMDESFLRCFDIGQILQAGVSSLNHAKNSKAREVWVKSEGQDVPFCHVMLISR